MFRLTVAALAICALIAGVVAAAAANPRSDAEFNSFLQTEWDQADYKEIHPLIGSLAVKMMSPLARKAATQLVRDIPAEAGWADRLVFTEPKQPWVSPLHFINLPDGACKYNRAQDCKGKAGEPNVCVDGAIQVHSYLLAAFHLCILTQFWPAFPFLFVLPFRTELHRSFGQSVTRHPAACRGIEIHCPFHR